MQSAMNVASAVFLLSLLVQHGGGVVYDIVTTKSGVLKGIRTPKCSKFLGIPFATAERFADPKPIQPWTSTRDATTTGPMCYQKCPTFPKKICQKRMSEDCLFLNVYRPLADSKQEGESYAVMVFIHGGNFESYSGGSPLFDGEEFVSTGKVILVTLNYRLGAFGFLAIVEDGQMTSGNFGLKDQNLALEWIHDNINYFGGNSSKITLFGQSSGAQSVVLHLLSPSKSNLFQQVIIESCPFTLPFRNLEEASKQTRLFSKHLGCQVNDFSCYRKKTSTDILRAAYSTTKKFSKNLLMQFQPFGPVMNGKSVPRMLLDGFKKAQKLGKNIIIGTNTQEGAEYSRSFLKIDLPLSIGFMLMSSTFPTIAPAMRKLYGGCNGTNEVLTKCITDYIFYCSSRRFADLVTSHGDKLWFYTFGQSVSFGDTGKQSGCKNEVCHGAELPYVFGTNALIGYNATEGDEMLKSRMMHFWTNFAKFGTPNKSANDHLFWPNYKNVPENRGLAMYFDDSHLNAKHVDRNKYCQYFNKLGYNFGRI